MHSSQDISDIVVDRRYHFFICHHQGSGGNQAHALFMQLKALGCSVWWDNDQEINERNLEGMRRGVRESVTLLILMTGRKERDGQPDPEGDYEGVFSRPYCHKEMRAALVRPLPFFFWTFNSDPKKNRS